MKITELLKQDAISKATGSEIDTGTNDVKFATAKALADSSYTKSALPLAGGTMTGRLDLATGTTTKAPIKLTAGTNLTTELAGALEFDGSNLFLTV